MVLLAEIVLLLSIFLTTFNRGFFSFAGFAILISLFLLLLFLFFKDKNYRLKSTKNSFPFTLLVVYSLFLFFTGGIYQIEPKASFLLTFLPICFYMVIFSYLSHKNLSKKIINIRFCLLITFAFILRILTIIASPAPIIDVYTILKEAPLVFLSGKNPYDTIYPTVYQGVATDYYPYWPASFLLELPFVYLFSDPRVLLAFSDIGCALIIYLLGKRTPAAQIFSLIYLFRPNGNFIIEQSWLTPLISVLIYLIYWLLENKKEILLGVVLGVVSGVQPIYLLLLPFILFLVRNVKRVIISCSAVLFSTVVPFLLWSPAKFIDKTILVYFKPPGEIPTIPIHLSLNLNTFFYLFTNKDIPFIVSLLFLFIITLFIFAKLSKEKKDQFFEQKILLGLALFFLSFYLFFRQSFINYYYFVGNLIILWLVIRGRPLKTI